MSTVTFPSSEPTMRISPERMWRATLAPAGICASKWGMPRSEISVLSLAPVDRGRRTSEKAAKDARADRKERGFIDTPPEWALLQKDTPIGRKKFHERS